MNFVRTLRAVFFSFGRSMSDFTADRTACQQHTHSVTAKAS